MTAIASAGDTYVSVWSVPRCRGHRRGLLGFVVFRLFETDRERPHRAGALRLHHGRRRARNRSRPTGTRPAERRRSSAGRRPGGASRPGRGRRLPATRRNDRKARPRPPPGRTSNGPSVLRGSRHDDLDARGRGELRNSLKDRVRRRHVAEARVERQGVAIHLRGKGGMRPQGLDLRAEEEDVSHPSVIHRLLAEPVPYEMEGALLPVPESDREHSVPPLEGALRSPLDGSGENAPPCRNARGNDDRELRAPRGARGSCRSPRSTSAPIAHRSRPSADVPRASGR